jgi:hypothetical protein
MVGAMAKTMNIKSDADFIISKNTLVSKLIHLPDLDRTIVYYFL